MPALGRHSLFDLHGCDPARLASLEVVRAALLGAITEAGGTVVTSTFHQFSPHGVSGIVVITESHLTVHTWPEHSFAAADLFTCGPALDHAEVGGRVAAALGAQRTGCRTVDRG